jgi:four helix bundle protein
MKGDNIIREKSYLFALRIIKLNQFLSNKKEFVIAKQILRSGTSIGANVEEAIGSQSLKEFYSKMCLVYKEARETEYWLRLLRDSDIISVVQSESLIRDCQELIRITGRIQKTLKEKSIRNS